MHTFFYVRETGSLDLVILEFADIELATGWLAFVVLSVLAVTSNDICVRSMGKWWKTLQRAAYLAAVITALHWYLFNQFLNDLVLWFGTIALLQGARLLTQKPGTRRKAATPSILNQSGPNGSAE